ncbi:hypothetical protein [Roseospira navarrensis]|uniref:Uncharacterized protein n=1 Tax=Roseospira navarrensis TaxID=140058 RepID=A0A7X1ZB30_9PROT|nr:hypothetical protein [Roseospira navarrensis]MQX35276.1 hypothetical protein [Roseospira navarrensis]
MRRWVSGLWSALTLGGTTLALAALPAGPGAAQSSQWDTDFGPLVLTVRDGDRVTGLYPDYTGRVEATLDRAQRSIAGVWRQPNARMRCEQAYEGSHYWGLVTWSLPDETSLRGQWSYCDNPPGSAGVWNGTFVRGTPPLSTGMGAAPPSAPPSAQSGAPRPDAAETARFLWGQSVDPSRLTVRRDDVTCDGEPDLSLVYLDLDHPEGPFLAVAVREPGAALEEIPVTYLDFDTGGYASLCGSARMVDVSVVGDLEPETVRDLTGFNAPPLCRIGIRLDDGMCDAIWLFGNLGPGFLADLVVGRN